ncbi:proteasome inhibitor PI31 subunit [Bombina bombina]|uniref:proteasome inhibitor PI31 subunit n=1 Tax=Bombina bombina TaxID=8345 RepID=UPI00235A61C7|nr:proteasome inhibitor PI31 subunit [Bombina bombina]
MAGPGLELLFASVRPVLSRPQDALVCFIHWEFVSHGLRCVGMGDKAGADEKGSELLPEGWCDNKELYTLRYGKNDTSEVLLKALPVENTLIVNVLELQTEKVCDLTLSMEEFIDHDSLQQYDRVYKNLSELRSRFVSEIISPLLWSKEEKKEVTSEPKQDPLRVPNRDPRSHPTPWYNLPSHRTDPRRNFPYGAADLDPLGGHSGGMVFDPLRSGQPRPRFDPLRGLPPGAVPPGARFDPFGPVGPGHPGPDPNHLPPPGYDDMFL